MHDQGPLKIFRPLKGETPKNMVFSVFLNFVAN